MSAPIKGCSQMDLGPRYRRVTILQAFHVQKYVHGLEVGVKPTFSSELYEATLDLKKIRLGTPRSD